ncbi:MAG: cobalamin B12-binding domain-containing protein [Thermoanaerobacteraceae bacterium]|nr:cobalamin B12-binding domain-containing protein [Thermoanaerobacteraceae bacterium]
MPSLVWALGELNEKLALELVRDKLAAGVPPLDIVEECKRGLAAVGERYSRGEYFLGDLVLSGEIFQEIMHILNPVLAGGEKPATAGKIVFGTVEGDIHDIGKNITISLLRCHGFEVYDLGVNVPPDKFVYWLNKTGSQILCLSTLLTSCFDVLKRTVRLVRMIEQEQRVRVLIGGLVNERVRAYAGADQWVTDARRGVELCLQWNGVQ